MMKIEITTDDKTGRPEIVLQSTNQEEREAILSMYARFNTKNPTSSFVKAVEKHNENKPTRKRRRVYTRECDVKRCGKRFKGNLGRAVHMLRSHGVDKQGNIVESYMFKGTPHSIPKPVRFNSNGKLELFTKHMLVREQLNNLA